MVISTNDADERVAQESSSRHSAVAYRHYLGAMLRDDSDSSDGRRIESKASQKADPKASPKTGPKVGQGGKDQGKGPGKEVLATSAEILELLAQLNARGKTIIMVTHEEDIAAHARRVIRMRDGLVLSDEQRTKRGA